MPPRGFNQKNGGVGKKEPVWPADERANKKSRREQRLKSSREREDEEEEEEFIIDSTIAAEIDNETIDPIVEQFVHDETIPPETTAHVAAVSEDIERRRQEVAQLLQTDNVDVAEGLVEIFESIERTGRVQSWREALGKLPESERQSLFKNLPGLAILEQRAGQVRFIVPSHGRVPCRELVVNTETRRVENIHEIGLPAGDNGVIMPEKGDDSWTSRPLLWRNPNMQPDEWRRSHEVDVAVLERALRFMDDDQWKAVVAPEVLLESEAGKKDITPTTESSVEKMPNVLEWQASYRNGKYGGLILDATLSDGSIVRARQAYDQETGERGPLYVTNTEQRKNETSSETRTLSMSAQKEETLRAWATHKVGEVEDMIKNGSLEKMTGLIVPPTIETPPTPTAEGEKEVVMPSLPTSSEKEEEDNDVSPVIPLPPLPARPPSTAKDDDEVTPFMPLPPLPRRAKKTVDENEITPFMPLPPLTKPKPAEVPPIPEPSVVKILDKEPEITPVVPKVPKPRKPRKVKESKPETPSPVLPPEITPVVPSPEPPRPVPVTPAERRRIGLVDVSDTIRTSSLDQAERELAGETRQPGIMGYLRHMWRQSVAVGYYRRRMQESARARILQNENIYGGGRGDRSAHERTMAEVVERFTVGNPELIHELAGERILGETPEERAAQQQIQRGVNELIRDYARGHLNDASFREERNRLLNSIPGLAREALDGGEMFADNMLRMAQEVRHNVEHGIGLGALDEEFEVVIGRARLGQRTEEQRSMITRAIDRMRAMGVTRFLPETVLASAISISAGIASAGSFGAQTAARTAARMAGGLGLGALVGGGIAYIKESRRTAEERQHHARERAVSRAFNERESPRRQEMEQYIHTARDAGTLTESLSTMADQIEAGTALTPEQFTAAVQQLAEARARNQLSDSRHVDLLSYSRVEAVESERTALIIACGRAQRVLSGAAASSAGLLPRGNNFEQYLETTIQCNLREMGEGMEQRDRAFRGFQRHRAGRAAVRAVVVGLGVGAIAQEGAAFLRGNQAGLLENFIRPEHHGVSTATPLEYLRRWMSGELEMPNLPSTHDVILGARHLRLPIGADYVINPNGTIAIVQAGERIADNLPLNPDQSFTDEALRILSDHGLATESHQALITGTETIQASAEDYTQDHPGLFTRVMRGLWNDNNTPKPVFDLNEKNFDIIEDKLGNIVLSAKRMIPEGSFHDKHMADAIALAKEGKLKVLLSLTKGTQRFVRSFVMNENMQVVLDPHSMTDVDKLMFAGSGKALRFVGGFAEIAETLGHNSDGIEQVGLLATVEGAGVPSIEDTITTASDRAVTSIHSLAPLMEGPWFIPVPQSREPLGESWPGWGEDYHYDTMSREELERYRKQWSPRLLENPNVKLDHYREAKDYFARFDKQRRDETEAMAAELPPMDPDCRLAVCIPVAGSQEGDNIYRTLDAYSDQRAKDGSKLDPKSFEIFLFVNNPKGTSADKVMSEIARFQGDHPEMPVRVLHKEFNEADMTIGGMRKYGTDIALMRHEKLGADVPDLIIVSNDADCLGLSPQYLSEVMESLEGNDPEDSDAMLGKFDWDPESYADSPLYHAGTRMGQFLDAAIRHHPDLRRRNIPSSGANFAFKGSMYAAINGYDIQKKKGEDVRLGNMMKAGRKGAKQRHAITYGNDKTMLYTHPRRGISAVNRGIAPVLQWSEFHVVDPVRDVPWVPSGRTPEQMIQLLDNPAEQEKLREGIELFLKQSFEVYGISKTDWAVRQTMRFLKLRYEIKGDEIHITDMSKLIEDLKEYQKTWRATKKHKTTHVVTPSTAARRSTASRSTGRTRTKT